jgi:hypothetical protein
MNINELQSKYDAAMSKVERLYKAYKDVCRDSSATDHQFSQAADAWSEAFNESMVVWNTLVAARRESGIEWRETRRGGVI